MPDVDNSVALGVKPASFDISSPLMTLAQLQMAKSHSDLYGAQAKYQGLRLNALQAMSDNPNSPEAFNQLAAVDPDTAKNYLAVSQQNKQIGAQQNFGKAVNAGDPNAPNQLAAFPEAYKTGVEATSNRNTDQRAQTNQKLDLIGRAAQAALDAGPDGSKARTDAAHASLDSLLKQGAITQADHDRAFGNVTDAGLKHAVAVSMSPKDYMEASGQTAQAKPMKVSPEESVVIPSKMVAGGEQPVADGTAAQSPNAPGVVKQGMSPGEKKQQEVTAEGIAKLVSDKQNAIPGVAQSLNSIHELRGAIKNLPTGPGTITVADAGSFLSRFGMDINKVLPNGWQTDPTKVNIAQKNITQLAAAYAKGEFPNRITNNDMVIAMNATPNLWNNEKANDTLLDNLEAVQRIKLEEAQFYRNSPDNKSFKVIDKWNDHLNDLSGVPDNVKQSYMSYSDLGKTPALQGAAGGAATNLPEGAVRSAIGKSGTIFQHKTQNGYEWRDKNGNPL